MKIFLFLAVFSLVLASANAQIKVDSNGRVGIMTSSPVYKMDMNVDSYRSYFSTRQPLITNHFGTDPRLCTTSHIVFYKPDATGFIDIQCKTLYEYSDSTAKENISSLADRKSLPAGSNIDKIKKLTGVNYNWKNDIDKKLQAGFLAQEVEAVIPEAVITDDSTQNKSLAYSAILPYLVEAIKEQQAEIEALKKLVNK